jgi:serine/threonine-protein kinase
LANLDDLLKALEAARLVPGRSLRDRARDWDPSAKPAECVAELVEAGLLTPWQANRVLAGRARSSRLGPYRLLDRLGNGRSPVFQAEHVLLRRRVVVKILGRISAASPRLATREKRQTDHPASSLPGLERTWCREVEATGMFDHPHIVRALDARVVRGRLLLVLEYLDGPDLRQVLEREGPLPVERACAVVEQTCRALAALHDRGLVHRDVKPANLIQVAREPFHVKLIDLGLACLLQANDELCGTPDYMAPERGATDGGLDPRSDFYSLGCTFYQLLTGQVPFPGGSGASKLVRHRLDVPIPVCVVRPEVPEPVGRLVLALMAREPEARPATARDVLAALQQALSSSAPLPGLGASQLEPDAPASQLEPDAPARESEWCEEPPRSRVGLEAAPAVGPGIRRIAADLPASKRVLRLRSWMAPLLVSILVGTLAGLVTRITLGRANAEGPNEERAAGSTTEKPSAVPRISIEGSSETYPELAEAVAAAQNGAVLVLQGRGLLPSPPVDLRGKALTFRAEPGEDTGLVRVNPAEKATGWEPLLLADRSLRLVGLTLQDADTGDGANPVPLISQQGGELKIEDCVLRGRSPAPLVLARRTPRLVIQGGRFEGEGVGLSIEAAGEGEQTVVVQRATLQFPGGAALSLWAGEDAPAGSLDLLLQETTVEADRVLSCRHLPGQLVLRLGNNRLHFRESLVSFLGYPDGAGWQTRTRWHLQGNRYHPERPWVSTESQRFPLQEP